MMTRKKRVVTTSKRRERKTTKGDFLFSEKMIPVWSNGKSEPEFLSAYRNKGWKKYQEFSLPSTREEAWRRTDIKRMAVDVFELDAEAAKTSQVPEELLKPLVGEEHGGQVTLMPWSTEVYLAPELAEKGIIFTDMKTAALEHPQVLEKVLGKIVAVDEDKFTAMTAALSRQGVVLYVPKGIDVELPLHSVYWGSGQKQAFFSNVLVYLEEGSSATYLHEYASTEEDGQSMHSGIVEIFVGKAANLRFVEFQSWGKHIWNFSHERAKVERDANLDWIFGAVGSHLTKNFTEIDLVGEGSTGRMSGFYFTDGEQHLDHDTQQNHNAPNTTSDLLFKGALKDKSRSVWQGMIYVAPDAQKTDGYQANPNLLLDTTARADSIPGLEIMADDVRCTHGATVGKIDPTEVFYLNSRGIPTETAERLIVEGFFDPIMQRIPFEGVRERLQKAIIDKLA
jgi:Fe-S cluster assembly protein SufD